MFKPNLKLIILLASVAIFYFLNVPVAIAAGLNERCGVEIIKVDCDDGLTCHEGKCIRKGAEGEAGGGSGEEDKKDQSLGYDLTIQGVGRIITGIACWLIGVIFAVMIIALVVAGVRFFLASGNASRVEAARKNLLWVVIGIAVIIATNIIIATIAGFLGADYSVLPLKCGVSVKFEAKPCTEEGKCDSGSVCKPSPDSPTGGLCVPTE